MRWPYVHCAKCIHSNNTDTHNNRAIRIVSHQLVFLCINVARKLHIRWRYQFMNNVDCIDFQFWELCVHSAGKMYPNHGHNKQSIMATKRAFYRWILTLRNALQLNHWLWQFLILMFFFFVSFPFCSFTTSKSSFDAADPFPTQITYSWAILLIAAISV